MKRAFTRNALCFGTPLVLMNLPRIANAQFTVGNVVVLQAGTGAGALSSAGTPVVLLEYNTATANQTSPVKTVYVDSTGAARLSISGTAISEGQMTLSSDSSHLVVPGYDAAVGTAAITTSSAATVPRAIDTLSNFALTGRADTTRTGLSGGNMRSAVRNNSENYWAAGSTTGLHYMGNLSTPNTIYNSTVNLRALQAANGKLYFSTMSGLARIGRINAQPTSGLVVADTMIALGTGSPYGFVINAAESIAYVADDRSAASGGGIQKWTLSGGTWSLAYTLSTGTTGARSVIADWSGTNAKLYVITATATAGLLLRIIDSNAAATPLTLATAPANAAFRSVAFAPRPCIAPSLSLAATPVTCTASGSVTLTTTGGSGPFTYSYTGPGTFSATTPNIFKLAAGTYTATVTASGGCRATASATVANNATRRATVVTRISRDTLCAGDTIRINAYAAPGYKYQWIGDPITWIKADSNFIAITPVTLPGIFNYSFNVITITPTGCIDTSLRYSTAVNPLPTPPIVNNAGVLSTSLFASYQWYMHGLAIAGATGNSYTAATNDSYYVLVTNAAGCRGISPEIIVTGVGISNVLASQNIRLYPNPVQDELRIDAPFNVVVVIKDMQGRTLLSAENRKVISLSNLAPGTFSVFVYTTSGALIGTQVIARTSR